MPLRIRCTRPFHPLAALLSAAILAGAARAVDVVNNLALAADPVAGVLDAPGEAGAQAFTTGALPIRLESVTVSLKAMAGAAPSARVGVWTGDGAFPVALIEDLGPASVPTNGAPANLVFASALKPTLAASTRHWVSVTHVEGGVGWDQTTSTTFTGTGSIPRNATAPLAVRASSVNGGARWSRMSTALNHKVSVTGSQVHTVLNTNNTGAGSLRQVVSGVTAGDTILFHPTLDGQTITLTTTPLVLTKSMTIDAGGLPRGLTLSGDNARTNFTVLAPTGTPVVSLRGLALTGATSGGVSSGAIVHWSGHLALSHCTLSGNHEPAGWAGAIYSIAPGWSLVLDHCTLAGNSGHHSGAIYAEGTVTLRQCTLTGNTAASGSGGGLNLGSGACFLENCIVSGNAAPLHPDAADIQNGGFLYCFGANLVQAIAGRTPSGTGTLNPAPPRLAGLGHYGGPAMTRPPLPDSPAVNAALGFPGATDQRGLAIGTHAYQNDFSAGLAGAGVLTSGGQPLSGTLDAGSFRFTANATGQVASLVIPAPGPFTTFAAHFGLSSGTASGNDISISLGPAPGSVVGAGGVPGTHRILINPRADSTTGIVTYIPPAGNYADSRTFFTLNNGAGLANPYSISLDASGSLRVTFRGSTIIEISDLGYTHAAGDTFTFGADTDYGPTEQRIDNLGILTDPVGGAPDIGAMEYLPAHDIPLFWPLDADGDGNPFGLEFALGTDDLLPDPVDGRNLRALAPTGGVMRLAFGRNPTAEPYTLWRLTRSTTLLPGSYTEIFRYDGPTRAATHAGTIATLHPSAFEITDIATPEDRAYYRLEAIPRP